MFSKLKKNLKFLQEIIRRDKNNSIDKPGYKRRDMKNGRQDGGFILHVNLKIHTRNKMILKTRE